MGLGKTVQCISLVAYLIEMGVKGPFLVAAPLSTLPNWLSEFHRFTPKVKYNHFVQALIIVISQVWHHKNFILVLSILLIPFPIGNQKDVQTSNLTTVK